MNRKEAEAGPSRHRRSATPPPRTSGPSATDRRPASPETALAGTDEGSRLRSGERESSRGARRDGQDDVRMSPEASNGGERDGASVAGIDTGTGTGPPPPLPRLDLAKYHTPSLLRLLANLLQQIASANDQIRPELEEFDEDDPHMAAAEVKEGGAGAGTEGASSNGERQGRSTSVTTGTNSVAGSRTASRASSRSTSTAKRPHPSPTSALFPDTSSFSPSSETSSASSHPRPSASDPHPASLYAQPPDSLFSASKTSLLHPASLLSFHARHVPSISIEAYLLRILKYCPTTNEVFLSLLVYFDRMSKLGTAQGLGGESVDPTGHGKGGRGGRGFAIDSYNVHRLVIAGVTVASKFFSDVFYTNSRYAKVGGLPPSELNQLELQFLLLNDFRLAIPIEEMQRYGDRLLVYSESKEQVQAQAQAGTVPGQERHSSRPASSSRTRTSASTATAADGAARAEGEKRNGEDGAGDVNRRDHSGAKQSSTEDSMASAPAAPSSKPRPATNAPSSSTASTAAPIARQTGQGGIAVVKGASEAMEIDDDETTPSSLARDTARPQVSQAGSQSQAAAATTPVVTTAAATQTTANSAPSNFTPAPSLSQPQPQGHPNTTSTPLANNAHPAAAPTGVSRSVSFQRAKNADRSDITDRPDFGEMGAVAAAPGTRWGGAAEGIVSGST